MADTKAAQAKFTTIRFHNETARRFISWCKEMRYDYSDCMDKLMDLAGIPSYEEFSAWREEVRRQNPFTDELNKSVKRGNK